VKPLRVAAAVAMVAVFALAFAAWLRPDNVFAFASMQAFCQ